MTANIDPLFTLSPVMATARIASVANTNRDGSGTLTTLVTGDVYGTRIERVTVQGTLGSVTDGTIRFFVDDGAGNIHAIHEIAVVATTATASVSAWTAEWVRDDGLPILVLPHGYILKCASHNAEQFDFAAYGGSY